MIDTESVAEDRRQCWFWRVHDTLAIGRLWSEFVPPERIHVITMAPRGAGTSLLWQRFASLLGIDPGSVDISRARPNASLGLAEIEFLRRLNQAIPAEVPDWFYMWNVKEAVAHKALADRPAGGRLMLPADRETWAKDQAEILIAGLQDSGYDLVGDLTSSGPGNPPAPVPLPPTSRPSRCSTPRYRPRRHWWPTSTARSTRRGRAKTGAGPGSPAGSSRLSRRPRGSSGRYARSAAGPRPCAGCASWCGGSLSGPGPGDGPRWTSLGVIAVVVTYNRRDLLLEALAAVSAQTRAPDAVIVVDNASSDGTAAAVRAKFPAAQLAELTRNSGGAGGFAYGIAQALAGARGPHLAHGRRHRARTRRAGSIARGP